MAGPRYPAGRARSLGDWSLTATPLGVEDIAMGGHVLLDRIAFAVRDEHWATHRVPVAYDQVTTGPQGQVLRFGGADAGLGARLSGRLVASGSRLSVHHAFEVDRELAVSRAGPYLLHADPFRGVLRSDGTPSRTELPEEVTPDVVATGYTRLEYGVSGHLVVLEFAGERFEMEDQRNWGDACFKSYCPPLDRPRPLVVRPGRPLEYRISVVAEPGTGEIPPPPVATRPARFPALGARHTGGALAPDHAARLSELRLDFLHLSADLGAPGWERRLAADIRACRQLGARAVVTASVPPGGRARLPELAAASTVLVFDAGSPRTSPGLAAAAREVLPGVELGGGSRGFLAGLNRDGGAPGELDLVAFPIAAATHEDDQRSFLAGMSSYPAMLRTARRLAAGRELFVGPVTLRPVFDPWNPSRERGWTEPDLCAGTEFEARWTLAAAARLGAAGARTVSVSTLAALLGPAGLTPVGEALRRRAGGGHAR